MGDDCNMVGFGWYFVGMIGCLMFVMMYIDVFGLNSFQNVGLSLLFSNMNMLVFMFMYFVFEYWVVEFGVGILLVLMLCGYGSIVLLFDCIFVGVYGCFLLIDFVNM